MSLRLEWGIQKEDEKDFYNFPDLGLVVEDNSVSIPAYKLLEVISFLLRSKLDCPIECDHGDICLNIFTVEDGEV